MIRLGWRDIDLYVQGNHKTGGVDIETEGNCLLLVSAVGPVHSCESREAQATSLRLAAERGL